VNGPEIRAFRALGFVSGLRARRCSGANRRKSPAVLGNIPVLRGLSAETGAITTAARTADAFAAANTVAEQAADAEYAAIGKQEAPEIVKKHTPAQGIAA
jgi:hypothetical protein